MMKRGWRVLSVLGMAMLLGLVPHTAFAQLTVNIGGYIKLDASFQDQINRSGRLRIAPSPADVVFDEGPGKDRPRANNGQFLFDAKQTRLRVSAADDIDDTKLTGLVEADFFGGSGNDDNTSTGPNSGIFRLRHAKADVTVPLGIGRLTLLGGQYWSAFQNIEVPQPDLVDFNGPAGQLFARQPQLRLTYSIAVDPKTRLNLIGSVEAQAVNFLTTDASDAQFNFATGGGPGGPARQEGQNVPAFVGKIQWLSPFVKAEVAGVASRAKGIAPTGQAESAMVWGVQGSVDIPAGPVTVFLHGDALNGLNRLANADYADAVFRGPGRGVATIMTFGGYAGLTYKPMPTTTLTGLYGLRTADPSATSGFGRGTHAETDEVRQQSIHINVLQQFWTRFQIGLEYERLTVDAFRKNSGTENIYHAGLWLFF